MGEAFHLRSASWLSTGADGGHWYLSGFCDYEGSQVKVYAFLADKAEEERIRSLGSDTFALDCPRHDFIRGIGLSLWDCRLINGLMN